MSSNLCEIDGKNHYDKNELSYHKMVKNLFPAFYGIPEGTFLFRYLPEDKLKQENENGNQNNKYLV